MECKQYKLILVEEIANLYGFFMILLAFLYFLFCNIFERPYLSCCLLFGIFSAGLRDDQHFSLPGPQMHFSLPV